VEDAPSDQPGFARILEPAGELSMRAQHGRAFGKGDHMKDAL